MEPQLFVNSSFIRLSLTAKVSGTENGSQVLTDDPVTLLKGSSAHFLLCLLRRRQDEDEKVKQFAPHKQQPSGSQATNSRPGLRPGLSLT